MTIIGPDSAVIAAVGRDALRLTEERREVDPGIQATRNTRYVLPGKKVQGTHELCPCLLQQCDS